MTFFIPPPEPKAEEPSKIDTGKVTEPTNLV
jgi:hypothetical protein